MLKPRIALLLAGACGLLLGLAVVYSTPPERNPFLPPCLFHQFTGLHCPGCGTTRAVHALLHLRFGEAMRKNALFLSALPFLASWTIGGLTAWVRGRAFPTPAWLLRPGATPGILAAVLAFTILRNLPWPPFTWLAPH